MGPRKKKFNNRHSNQDDQSYKNKIRGFKKPSQLENTDNNSYDIESSRMQNGLERPNNSNHQDRSNSITAGKLVSKYFLRFLAGRC